MNLRSLLCSLLLVTAAFAQASSVWETRKSAWQTLAPTDRVNVESFATDFKAYIGTARTALASNAEMIRRARAAGFVEFHDASQVKPGAKLFVNNRDRAVALFVVGQEPIANGLRIVGTHQDSPHINLKARPIINRNGVALFKTIYYGGIKRYQWSNIPMGLQGRIATADGRILDVNIGFKTGDPVFVIADNAPHSDKPLRTRTETEVLSGEELDPVAATEPGDGTNIAANALRILKSMYNFKEEDLVGAELALVPVSQPADVGLDKALVGAYGQDDRLSSFCAARAVMDLKGTPRYTAVAYLTNFEETGSGNTTGAQTENFFTTVKQMIAAQAPHDASVDLTFRSALRRSVMVSADTNDGINPIFGETTSEASNAARVGFGPALKEYGGQFDAPAELNAKIRALLDANKIPWQTQTPRVDVGGGGTIGGYFSVRDIDVIDLGVPLLSMHSPYEMSSKVDDWYFYRFMSAFMQWDGK
jgi:aspartyl aminopeptidase